MDLFPTLLEEYDLTGAPGVNEFRDHIMKGIEDNMHRGHSGGKWCEFSWWLGPTR